MSYLTHGAAERGIGVPLLVLVLAAAAPSAVASGSEARPSDRQADERTFPTYPTIAGNVRFWTRVFGEWGLGQVAVHDVERPELVYEVVDLPGPLEGRYTDEQLEFVEQLNERWQQRLRSLADRVRERVPLDEDDKRLALEIATTLGSATLGDTADRVRTQRGLRERFRRGVEIGSRYDATFRRIFRERSLPEDLAYLPHVESSFQVAARSSAGAVGVWQFTRSTGRRHLRINAAIDERLDPVAAAHGAASYLAAAHERLQSWPLALTAYNHGVNGMMRAVRQLGPDYERIVSEYRGRTFGFASRNFYAEFLAAREVATHPERYFGDDLQPEPELDLEQIVLDRKATADGIARVYGIELDELVGLNPAWTSRAVRTGLPLPRGTVVWLPRGTLGAEDAQRGPAATTRLAALSVGRYVVQPGDTLSTIAEAFGVRLATLRQWNGLGPHDNLIHVGQRLRVAPPEERYHVVHRGDTLSSIAAAHGTSVTRLRELNGMAGDHSLIRVGQRLRLADGDAAEADARTHVVRRGDTLLRIALHYGVKLADLLLLNRLGEAAIIYPGQRLRIPAVAR